MNKKVLPPWPYFAADEIVAVTKVLHSGKVNYWTGSECKEFEKEFAEFIGVPYAISLANGTLALELALQALNIGADDDVIVPCRTFIASASCIVARGARPVVADIDPISQNLTVETISRVLTPKTKAIIAVHLAGWPVDLDPILEFAKKHNLKVIEDCAQAHGAKYHGKFVGSIGDCSAFSFCQDKIMTTGGEGGMFCTKDPELWKRAWTYKDHGKNPDVAFVKEAAAGFSWLHESFGSNFRLTEIQAVIGREQLKKLPEWINLRTKNAGILAKHFKHITALRLTQVPAKVNHAYYKYYAFLKPEQLKTDWNRDRILREINALGVPCGSGSCGEIYLEKAFINSGYGIDKRFSVAQKLAETSLMFLVHPTLQASDMEWMAEKVAEIFAKAT